MGELRPLRKKEAKFSEEINLRLKYWHFIIYCLFFFLAISRVIMLFFASHELLKINQIPNFVFYSYLQCFFWLSVWCIIFLFFYLKKEVKMEERLKYLKTIISWIISFTLIDLLVSTVFFIVGFNEFFTLKYDITTSEQLIRVEKLIPLLVIIGILLVLIIVQYSIFAFKRSMNIIKQYWISLYLLLLFLIVYILQNTAYHLGWYESPEQILKLCSWHYGYVGWIICIFFACTFFANTAAIIMLSFKNKWTSLHNVKLIMLPLLKIGFITAIMVSALVTIPDLFLWYY